MAKFTQTHEWAEVDQNPVTMGISKYAADELGDIVYISLPEVGQTVTAGDPMCEVESVKAVSEINAPVTGTVVEVNLDLEDSPELINNAPYDAWIIEVEVSEREEMMTEEEYAEFCKQ